jgi:hypothetical protein
MKIGTETVENMLSSKIIKAEVFSHFQDGRRRRFDNKGERHKMGNYHPILMKIGTQTRKNMLCSKLTKAEV